MSQNPREEGSSAPRTPEKYAQSQLVSASLSEAENRAARTPGSGRGSNRLQERIARILTSLYDEETSTVSEFRFPSLAKTNSPGTRNELEAKPEGTRERGAFDTFSAHSPSIVQGSEDTGSTSATQTSINGVEISIRCRDSALSDMQHCNQVIGESEELETSSQRPTACENSGKESTDTAKPKLRMEWIGTSQLYVADCINAQAEGDLDKLIDYRKSLVRDLCFTPYDPSIYIQLSRLDNKLGFTDIGTGNAYKALVLVESALGVTINSSLPKLQSQVLSFLSLSQFISSQIVLNAELGNMRRLAYIELLEGLLGCCAFWDGLKEAKTAMELFPEDVEIPKLRDKLKERFRERHYGLRNIGTRMEDIATESRIGKINPKKYPWMDPTFYIRTPAFMREINSTLASKRCELRPVVFGRPPGTLQTESEQLLENQDVGPLGLFATCNISEGESMMVDRTLLSISDVPSSCLVCCDSCNACLLPPYRSFNDIVHPTCCKAVAYCSQHCHDAAISGHHTILCGRNMDWLYEEINGNAGHTQAPGTRWCAILFLRLVAVVLGDMQKPRNRVSNPLQHHLVVRMTANYAPRGELQFGLPHDWQFLENIVMPTKILLGLGVDIFKDRNWDPEVVQTIFWRIDNNANMGFNNFFHKSSPSPVLQPTFVTGSKHQKSRSLPATIHPPSISALGKFVADGGQIKTSSLNPSYIFFNHSCVPNVSWHTAMPSPDVGISWLGDEDGSMMLPGNSAVTCTAKRDIKCGEELTISYIGEPLGEQHAAQKGGASKELTGGITCEETDDYDTASREIKRKLLSKWFENGCGCEACEAENEAERQKEREQEGDAELET